MGKSADAVVAAVVAAGHGNTEAVTDFKVLVAKIDANAAAMEKAGAIAAEGIAALDNAIAGATEQAVPAMPLEEAGEAVREPLVLTAVEVAANDNAAPRAPEGSLARILEDHLDKHLATGTTDDVRAPLELPKVVKPKAPRKPLINWPAVQGSMKAFGNATKQVLGRAGNLVGAAVVGFIVISFYGILQVIPGLFYVVGWTIKELATAYSNGYNQRPLFNNKMPEFGSKPKAVVVVAE